MEKFNFEKYIKEISRIKTSLSDDEYNKKKEQINKNYDIILEYCLEDAWWMPSYYLFVFDKKEDNIALINKDNKMINATITQKELDIIKDFLGKNVILYEKEKYAVSPPVLDGTADKIMISYNNQFVEIHCDNLWYWMDNSIMKVYGVQKVANKCMKIIDHDEDDDVGNVKYTKAIVNLLKMLKKIMKNHNIDISFDLEDEDEEDE